ncbi:pimeloyl-ACP methyl ester carboxylesterase [Chitinophaga sp. W3I9]|uniref:epoxide hydrolase family protein n=1 Tax=unclassified Chitinophaga TaxID=2619133 RepID=UPI003D1C154E
MKQPYVINIDVSLLDDLRHRLAMTRWTNDINNDNWKTGTNTTYLKELCYYWLHNFDWKKNEAFLNSFSHFKTAIDNEGIHFIHEKGKGKTSVPLLLIHGYPDSFMRFLKVIPLLVAPDDGFSFDVVIPSIPGYGFSDIPTSPGMNPKRIASLFAKLMTEELGYSSFIVHGGDWGSTIAEQIAVNNSQILKGIHLTDIPWRHLFSISPDALTASEKKYVQTGQQWSQTEGGYAVIQSTKPQSLAYGLNDSPVGLAAWLIEKFFSWSGCDGKLENTFTKDELLTNLTIYWATQTITSAVRLYYEAAVSIQQEEKNMEIKKVEVPTGVAIFPQDVVPAPREFAERLFNVQQWTEMPRGGHFTAMEQPDLFAGDVRKFAKSLSGVSLR